MPFCTALPPLHKGRASRTRCRWCRGAFSMKIALLPQAGPGRHRSEGPLDNITSCLGSATRGGRCGAGVAYGGDFIPVQAGRARFQAKPGPSLALDPCAPARFSAGFSAQPGRWATVQTGITLLSTAQVCSRQTHFRQRAAFPAKRPHPSRKMPFRGLPFRQNAFQARLTGGFIFDVTCSISKE